jgi:hypothetical protein
MIMGENYERNITPIRSDISRFSRGTILGLVANEQPLAETIEDLISTGASRSYCLSLFCLVTELPSEESNVKSSTSVNSAVGMPSPTKRSSS